MQLSRPGVVITPPFKDDMECETFGRFEGLLVVASFTTDREENLENRCRERRVVYLCEVMTRRAWR